MSRVGGLQDSIKLPKLSVYQITSQLNARSDSLQQLHETTQADDTLAILKYTIQKGWQSNIKESCRSLVFSGTVHWFVGRQAFIHYCGLHQV